MTDSKANRYTLRELSGAMGALGTMIPLTAANAVLSTASLLKKYWPDSRIKPQQLSLSIGLINLFLPFIGGIPVCHGAGGLAAKHYFGARTGGGNVLLGSIEILCGIFFASSIALALFYFPGAVLGAMLFLIGLELIKFALDVKPGPDILLMAVTAAVSVIANMAFGFLAGLSLHGLLSWRDNKRPAGKAQRKRSGL